MATATMTAGPAVYAGLDELPIAGECVPAVGGDTRPDTTPYSGKVLTEIALADRSDLDAAHAATREAQRDRAARPPAQRAGIMARPLRRPLGHGSSPRTIGSRSSMSRRDYTI